MQLHSPGILWKSYRQHPRICVSSQPTGVLCFAAKYKKRTPRFLTNNKAAAALHFFSEGTSSGGVNFVTNPGSAANRRRMRISFLRDSCSSQSHLIRRHSSIQQNQKPPLRGTGRRSGETPHHVAQKGLCQHETKRCCLNWMNPVQVDQPSGAENRLQRNSAELKAVSCRKKFQERNQHFKEPQQGFLLS